ncbi:MAG TPA: hypothetical protein PLU30_03360 [Verrucomicrobiae bacterium]|nr:hypothetical protein [Verrucomicrobiae bacterium]
MSRTSHLLVLSFANVERDENLYTSCRHGQEGCALPIISLPTLAIH